MENFLKAWKDHPEAMQKCSYIVYLQKYWKIKICFDTDENEPRQVCCTSRVREPWSGIVSVPVDHWAADVLLASPPRKKSKNPKCKEVGLSVEMENTGKSARGVASPALKKKKENRGQSSMEQLVEISDATNRKYRKGGWTGKGSSPRNRTKISQLASG